MTAFISMWYVKHVRQFSHVNNWASSIQDVSDKWGNRELNSAIGIKSTITLEPESTRSQLFNFWCLETLGLESTHTYLLKCLLVFNGWRICPNSLWACTFQKRELTFQHESLAFKCCLWSNWKGKYSTNIIFPRNKDLFLPRNHGGFQKTFQHTKMKLQRVKQHVVFIQIGRANCCLFSENP